MSPGRSTTSSAQNRTQKEVAPDSSIGEKVDALKKKIKDKAEELGELILEISAKAKGHRTYPRFEIGDRLDKAAIYVNAARTKLCRAIDALRE